METRGFDDLHAALFTESRTRGRRRQREVGNPGRDDKARAVTDLQFREPDGAEELPIRLADVEVSHHSPLVIPRACDFIRFRKKPMVKTKNLGASKSAKNQ